MAHLVSHWQRQALRWLWAPVGGLSLAVLLTACLEQPCGNVSAVATPPAILAAANGIFYVGQAYSEQINALRASDGARLWTGPIARFEGAAAGDVFFLKDTRLQALRDQDQSLLWQERVTGLTALAVDQGVVYITTTDAVSALRESDGSPLWQQQLAFTPMLLKAAAGSVYLFGPNGASALRERDGSPLWRANVFWSYASTLEVDSGTVYLTTDQRLQALRASDGTPLWQVDTSSAGTFLAAGGGMVYLATDKRLNALRASDGSLVWQVPTPTPGLPVASVLPLGESVIYFGLNRQIYAVRASDGSRLWEQGLQVPESGGKPALAATNGIIAVGTVESMPGSSCGLQVFYPVAASVSASNGGLLWYSKSNHP